MRAGHLYLFDAHNSKSHIYHCFGSMRLSESAQCLSQIKTFSPQCFFDCLIMQLVQDLKQECAGLYSSGHKRPRHMVAWSLQTYLIFAILSSVPDRQRTLRELQLGKTLVKEGGR